MEGRRIERGADDALGPKRANKVCGLRGTRKEARAPIGPGLALGVPLCRERRMCIIGLGLDGTPPPHREPRALDEDTPETGTESADPTAGPRAGTSRAARGPRGAGSAAGGTRDSLAAQVELLDDDSESVVRAVRSELEKGGARARAALGKAARDPRARLRARARDVIASMRRKGVLRRLARHGMRSRIDLESALFLLGNLAADPLDARPYRLALDAMAKEVRARAERETDGFRRVMTLCRYLGGELGYAGCQEDYHHTDHVHLHRVIERRSGMPLSLCALYAFVARRAGIRAAIVPLPGHVLLRLYHSGDRSVLVDPFQGGQPRSRSDCLEYLRECNLVPQPAWFEDAEDASMFLRHVRNLVNSYSLRGLKGRARELLRVAEILDRVQSRRRRVSVRD